MNAWNILEEELGKRNQFKKSYLTDEIRAVLECDEKTAMDKQDSHCNMLSVWAILYASGKIVMAYGEFFKFCLETDLSAKYKLCNVDGYMYATKQQLFKALDVEAKVTEYKTVPADRKPGDMYQVSINNLHHFIAAIVGDDNGVYVFDTNDRGLGVEIGRAFAKRHDKPDWFKRIA